MRVCIYARVSSDEQAERHTVLNQLDYLRERCRLDQLDVVDEYVDDGISGTIPLAQRPAGARLLADLRKFEAVWVFKVDRLARSLTVLLDAYNRLDAAGVAIKSAQEPFDTGDHFGKFLFQLLGSMAELERATILDRTSRGRRRVATEGKWIGGTVPIGYTVERGELMVSNEQIEQLGCTEADFVRDLFQRIGAGSSLMAECARLNALGVPSFHRYSNGKVAQRAKRWRESRLSWILNSTTYVGRHVFNSQYGEVVREVPALIDRALWDRAREQLKKNLSRAKSKSRFNLSKGLLKCYHCGATFVCRPLSPGRYYYRCTSQSSVKVPDRESRCYAVLLRADDIEDYVWQNCQSILASPDMITRAGQAIVDEYVSNDTEQQRQRLRADLAANALARDNILALLRQGRYTLDQAGPHLDILDAEAATLRTELDAADSLHERVTAYMESAREMQHFVRGLRYDENDLDQRRAIVEHLVERVEVFTNGRGREKHASITVRWRVLPPTVVSGFNIPGTAGRA